MSSKFLIQFLTFSLCSGVCYGVSIIFDHPIIRWASLIAAILGGLMAIAILCQAIIKSGKPSS